MRTWENGAGGAVHYYAMELPSNNVRGLFNMSGSLTHRYDYSPYGEGQAQSEGTHNPLRFAARDLDARTGMYYVRARWYDPFLGRFLNEDPIGLAGGINQYAYALNDPVNRSDPSGLDHRCNDSFVSRGTTVIVSYPGGCDGYGHQPGDYQPYDPNDRDDGSGPAEMPGLPGHGPPGGTNDSGEPGGEDGCQTVAMPFGEVARYCPLWANPAETQAALRRSAAEISTGWARSRRCVSETVQPSLGNALSDAKDIGETLVVVGAGEATPVRSVSRLLLLGTAWEAGFGVGKWIGRPIVCWTVPGFYDY